MKPPCSLPRCSVALGGLATLARLAEEQTRPEIHELAELPAIANVAADTANIRRNAEWLRNAFRAEGLDLENVFVTVPGTTNPELVYVVAAHFDAVRNVPDHVGDGVNVMGLVNHEVLGWTHDHRLGNTIRHKNDDLPDATHAAAFLFSEMITYDSYYTRSTDAAVFHAEYGEIVAPPTTPRRTR